MKNNKGISLLMLILIITVLIIVIGLTIFLFINNKQDNTDEIKTHISVQDTKDPITSGQYENSEIFLAENSYNETDKNYNTLKEIQGKISSIHMASTFPVILSENNFYIQSHGILSKKLSFDQTPNNLQYFDSRTYGHTVFEFYNGKVNCFDVDSGTLFKNIEFNPDTDYISEVDLSLSFFILSKQENGYIIKHYYKEDDTCKLIEETTLENFKNSNLENISVKEIVSLPSPRYGYVIYCITNQNEAYIVKDADSSTLKMETSTPLITNVNKILMPSNPSTDVSLPIYSKIGDELKVYSGTMGKSLTDFSDDFEISFIMPDSHRASEIKEILNCSNSLVFVFNNGDTYITDEIDRKKENHTTYEMRKLETISKLNSEGKILDMEGCTGFFDKIYLLMNDKKLYYMDVK